MERGLGMVAAPAGKEREGGCEAGFRPPGLPTQAGVRPAPASGRGEAGGPRRAPGRGRESARDGIARWRTPHSPRSLARASSLSLFRLTTGCFWAVFSNRSGSIAKKRKGSGAGRSLKRKLMRRRERAACVGALRCVSQRGRCDGEARRVSARTSTGETGNGWRRVRVESKKELTSARPFARFHPALSRLRPAPPSRASPLPSHPR